jgi:nucleoside-diphosphate-sugar epimerase
MGSILITGATGFIGQHLVDKLSQEGRELVLLSKRPSNNTIAVDLSCDTETKKIISDYQIKTVVHLASNVRSIRSNSDIDNEIDMAINVMSALKSPCRFIYLSTADEYATSPTALTENANLQPINPYAQAKFRTRQALEIESKRKGVELVILRPFLVYGLRQPSHMFISQLLDSIKNNKIFVYSARKKLRDYIHISDLIKAISMLIDFRSDIGGIYNVGTGIGTPLSKVIQLVESELNIKIKSERDAKLGLNNPDILVSNSEKLEKKIGWKSTIEFSQGLSELINNNYMVK